MKITRNVLQLACLASALVLFAGEPHAAVISGGGGSGGGGTANSDISSVVASTATNPSAETQLKELTIPAGTLNLQHRKITFHISGRYTTAAAQTPTMRYRTYLCTVSGCGSGTVLTLQDFTTSATTAATTNSWKIEGSIGTVSTGATGTVESKWWQQAQLGAAGDLTPETRLDQNNAVSAAIDLTGTLFLRTTVLMSTANAGNSVTARMAYIDGGGIGLAATDIDTCAEFAAIMTGETGTCGSLVFSDSPTLVTPNLGTPSTVTLTNGTGLPISTGVSGLGAGVATFLATPSSANLAAAVTGETGSGAAVFGTAPTVDSPVFTTKQNLAYGTAFPGAPATGDTIIITDDSAAGACDSAAGSAVSLCRYTGAAWAAVGDGGSGGSGLTHPQVMARSASGY